jgi:uncharacterized membrane protein YphA (DoxX/SURF4 family)
MEKRPGIIPELIIPVGAIAFSIYYLSTVWELPFQAKVVGIYVATAIGILSLVLFIRFGREVIKGQKSLGFHEFLSDPVSEGRRWTVLAMIIGFILLMPVLGFVVTIFSFVLCTVIIIGGLERWKAALITATSMTIVAFLVFIVFVKVRFPTTIIDETLKGIFL